MMMWTIDAGLEAKDASGFSRAEQHMRLVLFEQVFGFIQIYCTQILGARSMFDLGKPFLLQRNPLSYHKQPVGRIVTRATSDIDAMLELFNSGMMSAIGDLVKLSAWV